MAGFIHKPSIKRMIAGRASFSRALSHLHGMNTPRGYGWLTNPKKALYNRLYNRSTTSFQKILHQLSHKDKEEKE